MFFAIIVTSIDSVSPLRAKESTAYCQSSLWGAKSTAKFSVRVSSVVVVSFVVSSVVVTVLVYEYVTLI